MKLLKSIRMGIKFFWSRLKLAWGIAWKEEFPCVFVYCPNCGSFHVRHYNKYEDEDLVLGIVRCDGGYICEECGAKATFSEKWSLRSVRCRNCSRYDGGNKFTGDPDCFGEVMDSIRKLEQQKKEDGRIYAEEKFHASVHASDGYDASMHCSSCSSDSESGLEEADTYDFDVEGHPEGE